MPRADANAAGLRVLSMMIGVFLIFMAIDKIGWLTDAGFLTRRLQEWREMVRPLSRWYLDTVAIPGAPLFARLVPIAELSAGAALILGFRVRLAATLTFLMVLNFHFASDLIFRYSYLINAYGLPILGGLFALAIGGRQLPFSLSK